MLIRNKKLKLETLWFLALFTLLGIPSIQAKNVPPTITGDDAVSIGATATYTAAAPRCLGANTFLYSWSTSGGNVIGASDGSTVQINWITQGPQTLHLTITCLDGLNLVNQLAYTFSVFVSELPPPTMQDASGCDGVLIRLAPDGLLANHIYKWYSSETSTTPIITTGANGFYHDVIGAQTFYVSVDNGITESGRTIVQSTVLPTPTQAPIIVGNSFGCSNTSVIPLSAQYDPEGGLMPEFNWYKVLTDNSEELVHTGSDYEAASEVATYRVKGSYGTCEGPAAEFVITEIRTVPAVVAMPKNAVGFQIVDESGFLVEAVVEGLVEDPSNLVDDHVLTTDITSGIELFEARNTITASNTISGGADVTFKAGETIKLLQGFKVDKDSKFKGIISPSLVEDADYYWSYDTKPSLSNPKADVSQFLNSGEQIYLYANNGCWSEPVLYTAAGINLPDGSVGEEIVDNTNKPLGAEASMTEMHNYVRSYTMREAGTKEVDFDQLDILSTTEVMVSTTYFDGLGRSLQEVQKGVSPLGKDVVTYHKYDEFGRATRQYLAYSDVDGLSNGEFKTNAPEKQYTFYQNQADISNTNWAFSEVELEASPMNRALSQMAPGKSWVGEGRKVSSEILVNTEAEGIRHWKVIDHSNGDMELAEYSRDDTEDVFKDIYSTGELSISKTTNEQGNVSWAYTNKLGQTILTKAQLDNVTFVETYMVYDQFGQLRYVLPPEAVKLLANNSWDATFGHDATLQAKFEALIFKYRYDYRGRMVTKQLPSQDGEIKMVYDQLDRIILMQDANQDTINQWTYTQYDVLSRPVSSGLCIITGKTHDALQNEIGNQVSNTVFDKTAKDYVWNQFPYNHPNVASADIEEHSVTYYDGYEFDATIVASHDFQSVAEFTNVANTDFTTQTDQVVGMLIASKVKVLDGSSNWLWTVMHHDDKGRAIQVVGDNHLGGIDVTSTLQDDFNGEIIETRLTHTANSQTTNIVKRFDHDHIGRVLQTRYQINDEPEEEILSELTYNELGEVITKRLGNNLQKIDFAYNIRGWLSSINGLDLENPESGEPKDLWGAELSYDHGFNNKLHDGNISGMRWISARDGEIHAYGYQYDNLNRIKRADYRYDADHTGAWSNELKDFTVSGIEYDLNGNILKLNRKGGVAQDEAGNWTFGAMDQLEYTYDGNRLLAVDDLASTDASAKDFHDPNQLYSITNQAEYTYDANGNLLTDANKGLSGIAYNHQNLPTEVMTAEGRVVYTYDAAGIKLKKRIYDENNALKSTTDYLGDFLYTDNVIEFIHTDEGRVLKQGDNFKFEYHYKDHLGNLRLSFREEEAEYTVGMELTPEDKKDEEEANFDNIVSTRITNLDGSIGHHNTASAALLNGTDATKTMGPATVLTVEKGDEITFSVYAKYSSGGNFGVANNLTLPAIGANNDYGLEGSSVFGNGIGILITPLNVLNNNSNIPNAYAVIHLLDEEGNVLETHEKFVTEGTGYQPLSLHLEVSNSNAKYAALYVANESPTGVYFDDLALNHKRLVWQENNYYPFGMAIKPLDKEGAPNHRFQFNDMNERNEVLAWDETQFRTYDYQLGRFWQTDPKSEQFDAWSSYHYAYNNPIVYLDPDGQENTIYLYNHKDKNGQTQLTKKEMRQLRKELNSLLKSHGLKTRARIIKNAPNADDLDNTDTFVFVGTSEQALEFNHDESNNFDKLPDWVLTDKYNPEGASNPAAGTGHTGNIIYALTTKSKAILSLSSAYNVNETELMTGLIFHGAGHNSSLPHSALHGRWIEDTEEGRAAAAAEEKAYMEKNKGLVFGYGVEDRYTFMVGGKGVEERGTNFKKSMQRMTAAQKVKWRAKFGSKKSKNNLKKKK